MEILRELRKREEAVFYREVILKNRVFGETVYLSAQFGVARIYGYEITEVKKADEVRSRLAALVESADDAIISKDLKGIITTWNIGAEKLFGYTAEEAIGQNISFLVPPGHEDDTAALLSRIAMGEHIERFETLRMHKSGAVIPVSLTFSPIKDSNGRVVGASKIAHDISERRHAEEAIKQSEEQFRTLADSIPNLAWWADGDGYITWYNRRWYEYTGTTPEQMEGWGWQMVHDPDLLPEVMARWKTSLSNGEPFEMEFPLRRADGVFRPFLTRVLPLKSSEGRVLRWFGTNTDISALKEAEKEIRRSELRYRSYVEVTNQWAWVTAPDGMVVEDIPALRNFTGQTYDEARGGGWADALHPEDLEQTLEVWKQAVAGKMPYETEYRMRRHDGVYRLLLARGVPIFDEQGNVVEWVGTCTDITERKQAEAELKRRIQELSEANAELRRFTQASVGRELRMIEMKKEINELCARAGLPSRYSLDFEMNVTEGPE
jgi:PAS domain S-box-containing protein